MFDGETTHKINVMRTEFSLHIPFTLPLFF